jgi:hypothetical protein
MFENDNNLFRDLIAKTPTERARWFAWQLQDLINFECGNPMLVGMSEWEAKKEIATSNLYDHLDEHRALLQDDPAYARHYADMAQEQDIWQIQKSWGTGAHPEWPSDGIILRGGH